MLSHIREKVDGSMIDMKSKTVNVQEKKGIEFHE